VPEADTSAEILKESLPGLELLYPELRIALEGFQPQAKAAARKCLRQNAPHCQRLFSEGQELS